MTIDVPRIKASWRDAKKEALVLLELCSDKDSVGEVAKRLFVAVAISAGVVMVDLITIPMLAIDKVKQRNTRGK